MKQTDLVYIGVDGGGTKTAIGAFDANGRCVAEAICPPLNYHFIGLEAALSHLKAGIAQLHIPLERVVGVGIGDPAIDDVGESEVAHQFAAAVKAWLGIPVWIRSDAYMTLYGLTQGKQSGVLIISGTGSMAIAADADGRVSVAGGWGRLTGDEGSGYFIGLQGLRAALHAADGIAEPTALTEAALKHFKRNNPRDLIEVFYGEEEPDVAGFAKAVAASAESGDETARGILHETAQYLADYVSVLIRRSGANLVGVYGSVLRKNAAVRSEFEALLQERYPSITVMEPPIDAQSAAALYAKHMTERCD